MVNWAIVTQEVLNLKILHQIFLEKKLIIISHHLSVIVLIILTMEIILILFVDGVTAMEVTIGTIAATMLILVAVITIIVF